MPTARNIKELMAGGRSQEQAGRWEAAAAVYQRIVEGDPGNRDAVKRLLMVYRRLKDFSKELLTIGAALGAVAQRDQSAQGKWLAANPRAAKLGKAMLRSLGGTKVTAYGTDAFVGQLLKRKDLVERKISGVKRARSKTKSKSAGKIAKTKINPSSASKRPTGLLRAMPAEKLERETPNQAADKKKKEAAARRKAEHAAATKKKREEAAAKRAEAQERKEAAARAKKETAERKKVEKAAAMEEKRKAAEARAAEPQSFFVISVRYLVPLTKIDAAMSRHVTFLDKYFSSKVFLMAGRQVPRTGGIIIAHGKDRESVDRIMRQDPFVKAKLASFNIVEFKASRTTKRL